LIWRGGSGASAVATAGVGGVVLAVAPERAKAERVASVIIDIIHDNVTTKADVQAVRADPFRLPKRG
jgi:hypothetical protein